MRDYLQFLLFALFCGASASAQQPTAKEALGEPWLGLSVSKPDVVTATQLPALPMGIGFVVNEIAQGGPAEKAGIRKHDLLWKMGDQMLVNEGQLATLLRLSAPGDVVTLSIFREGKSSDLKVTLGESEIVRRMLADSVIRPDDGVIRVMNLEEKKAVIADLRGMAELTRRDDGYSIRITDKEGKVVFEADFGDHPELSSVPEDWRKQVSAMRRGLDHAINATLAPSMRHPRPRIVMPSLQEAPDLEEE